MPKKETNADIIKRNAAKYGMTTPNVTIPTVFNEETQTLELAKEEPLRPGLEWAIARCEALQTQGFDRTRLDVLIKDFKNCLGD